MPEVYDEKDLTFLDEPEGFEASELEFLDDAPEAAPGPPRTKVSAMARSLGLGVPEREIPQPDRATQGRRALELGAGLGAAAMTGGAGVPAMIGRVLAASGAGAGASLLSETFDPTVRPDVSGELRPAPLQRAAETAVAFGAGEGLASGIGAAGRGIGRLFRTTDPDRIAARELVREAGGVLPPAQATGRNPARILQGIGESSSIGSARIQAAKEGAESIAEGKVRQFAERFRERFGREELGSLIQDSVEGRTRGFLEASEEAYGAVDDALQRAIQKRVADTGAVIREGTRVEAQPIVSLAKTKAAARELLQRARQGLPGAEVTKILRQVLEKPDAVTFRAAQRLRSDLLRVNRTGTELIGGQARAASKRISGLVDESMADTARQAGGEVFEAWRQANAGFRQGAEVFNSRLIRKVASSQPEAVLEAILKPNRPGSVRMAKKAIGNAKVWEGIQREYLEDLMTRKAIDRSTDQLKGQRMLTELSRFGDSARELIGERNLKELQRFARILRVTQEQTGKGAGGVGIRAAAELGGLSLVLAGDPRGAALALAPTGVAYLFSNPTAVRWLTEGIKAPVGSQQAARAFIQVSQIIARNRADQN